MAQNKNLYVIVGGIASMFVFALLGFGIGGSSVENYSEQYLSIHSSNDAIEAVTEECVQSAVEESYESVEAAVEEVVNESAEQMWTE